MTAGLPSVSLKTQGGRSEAVLALVIVAVGIALTIGATSIPVPASANTVGPQFAPRVVGVLLALSGTWLLIDVLRGGRGVPEEEEDLDPTVTATDWRTVGIYVGAFVAHLSLLPVLGWPLAALLLYLGVLLAFARHIRVLDVAVAVAVVVTAYLLFSRVLGLGFSAGLLEGIL